MARVSAVVTAPDSRFFTHPFSPTAPCLTEKGLWISTDGINASPTYWLGAPGPPRAHLHFTGRHARLKLPCHLLEWLFEHFPGCQVAVEVVEAAAKKGKLEVLRLLLDHDIGYRERARCLQCGVNATHVVHWGGHSLVNAAENGHAEIVQWLYEEVAHKYEEAEVTNAIKAALHVGDMKVAELLLPPGKCILDYARFCSHPDVIEWEMDCGYLRRNAFRAGIAIQNLVKSGRLDLMKRIAAQHDPPPKNADWSTYWRGAMVDACVYGDCTTLKWLMEHPAGRWTCNGDDRLFSELVFSASYKGSLEVMEYLYQCVAVDKVRDGLLNAIRKGHFDLVKWLINHFPESEEIPDYCVMDEAARYGRLEMLEYFQGLDEFAVPGYFPVVSSPTRRTRHSSGEKFTCQMCVFASDDYLKVHSTVCKYRTEWLATEAMDDAAANGYLKVVKWLQRNRSEGCTTAAMDCAAANGHLEVVQWLHTHRSEGCTTKAMDGAAENGHLDVIKWLHSNRFEGCTSKAIEGALSNGHLQVASWLHNHLPSCTPTTVQLWRRPANLFEVLLFQFFHFSTSFSPAVVEYIRSLLLESSSKSNHTHIADWLQDKFPSAPGIRADEDW
ncbi:unnamed protein product [Phytophthora lilii]|uniref:Unnamed protein product n=1 Tax=Phytophthora lilii TaxID=2077276 RepID=A0A9W6X1B7_9STRA|nr:unnamed protein product [Phytophthora lilii]